MQVTPSPRLEVFTPISAKLPLSSTATHALRSPSGGWFSPTGILYSHITAPFSAAKLLTCPESLTETTVPSLSTASATIGAPPDAALAQRVRRSRVIKAISPLPTATAMYRPSRDIDAAVILSLHALFQSRQSATL